VLPTYSPDRAFAASNSWRCDAEALLYSQSAYNAAMLDNARQAINRRSLPGLLQLK